MLKQSGHKGTAACGLPGCASAFGIERTILSCFMYDVGYIILYCCVVCFFASVRSSLSAAARDSPCGKLGHCMPPRVQNKADAQTLNVRF